MIGTRYTEYAACVLGEILIDFTPQGVNKQGQRLFAGYKSKAVDATGAGDTFWGSFLYRVFKSGKAPEDITADEAASFADYSNAAASICVEGYGAIAAMPSEQETKDRFLQAGQIQNSSVFL